jgi:hypothetical protein
MKKIGYDYSQTIEDQDSHMIVDTIGGYCLVEDVEKGIYIHGSKDILLSRMYKPQTTIGVCIGNQLKFMHNDFDIDKEKKYITVTMPIIKDDIIDVENMDETKDVFLTYWVFEEMQDATRFLSYLIGILNIITIDNKEK